MNRFIGIDVGAETVKVVELTGEPGALRWTRRAAVEHRGRPSAALDELLAGFDWDGVRSAGVTGRLSAQVALPRIPTKQAQSAGARYLLGDLPVTVVSIGARGCTVLERRGGGVELFRENARCAQGTGHFLRQLVQRFGLEVTEAAALAAGVTDPAPLSGRCPVILKTDMTHLANKGEGRERILAGLLDAIAESAQVLVKPRLGPSRLALAGGVTRAARIRDHFDRFARRHGMVLDGWSADDGLHLDALGAALSAAEAPLPPPPRAALFQPAAAAPLEPLPSLSQALARVRRLPEPPRRAPPAPATRCSASTSARPAPRRCCSIWAPASPSGRPTCAPTAIRWARPRRWRGGCWPARPPGTGCSGSAPPARGARSSARCWPPATAARRSTWSTRSPPTPPAPATSIRASTPSSRSAARTPSTSGSTEGGWSTPP